MPRRSSNRRAEVRRPLKKGRALLLASFVQALEEVDISDARAARDVDVHDNTVARWLSGECAVNAEKVLDSKLLAVPFRRALCIHDHAPAGYVARRRAPVTNKRSAKARRGRP